MDFTYNDLTDLPFKKEDFRNGEITKNDGGSWITAEDIRVKGKYGPT